MLVKFMSLFLESSVWKFHTCDLNMKHWHQLRQMRIYKATFFKLINVIFLIAFIFIYLFLFYFWLCWVFVSARGLSLVVASGGHSSSRCAGLSLSRPLLLRSTGSRRAGSAVVAHGPSCSAACGIFPDQGSNLCSLHWQADSQPLRHQGSPMPNLWWVFYTYIMLQFGFVTFQVPDSHRW